MGSEFVYSSTQAHQIRLSTVTSTEGEVVSRMDDHALTPSLCYYALS